MGVERSETLAQIGLHLLMQPGGHCGVNAERDELKRR